MMYRVGRANYPQLDDPKFNDDLAAAMAYAYPILAHMVCRKT
jgi:hypothetical protein